jgi:hypothetical protein
MSAPQKPDETHSTPPAKPDKSPPTTLTALPEELLEKIFKNLEPEKYTPIGQRFYHVESYVALSLTSKQFRRIVLPLNTLGYLDWNQLLFYLQWTQWTEEGTHWSTSRKRQVQIKEWAWRPTRK